MVIPEVVVPPADALLDRVRLVVLEVRVEFLELESGLLGLVLEPNMVERWELLLGRRPPTTPGPSSARHVRQRHTTAKEIVVRRVKDAVDTKDREGVYRTTGDVRNSILDKLGGPLNKDFFNKRKGFW